MSRGSGRWSVLDETAYWIAVKSNQQHSKPDPSNTEASCWLDDDSPATRFKRKLALRLIEAEAARALEANSTTD